MGAPRILKKNQQKNVLEFYKKSTRILRKIKKKKSGLVVGKRYAVSRHLQDQQGIQE